MIFLLYKFFIRALLLPQICLQIFCSKHFAKLPKLIQTTQNCVKSSRRPFEQSLFSLPILTVLRDRKYCLIQAIHFSKLLCKKVTKKETPLRILFAIVFPFKIVNDMMSGKGLQTHGRQAALCVNNSSSTTNYFPPSFFLAEIIYLSAKTAWLPNNKREGSLPPRALRRWLQLVPPRCSKKYPRKKLHIPDCAVEGLSLIYLLIHNLGK